MGPSMCCCGALLGTRIAYGASGGAPSSSPWRFSIRPRTFAEIPWRREVLCTWSPTNHTRRRQGLRTGSPDAVGRRARILRCGQGAYAVAVNRGIAALDGFANANPVGVQTRNGESHGKDQIFLSQGPGGYLRRPHIRPRERGNPGPECGRDIGRGCDRNGYTGQCLASLPSSALLRAPAFLPAAPLPSSLVVASETLWLSWCQALPGLTPRMLSPHGTRCRVDQPGWRRARCKGEACIIAHQNVDLHALVRWP